MIYQNTFYLTSKTNRSVRLQCSGGWGGASADINADSGAHLVSATSIMQSVRASTKLSFASVSLWSRSKRVSAGSSGAWNVIGWSSSELTVPRRKFCMPPVAPISGNVNARCPSILWLLLSIINVGLPSAGSLLNALGSIGELVSDRRNGEWCDAGLICQTAGGGGVSDRDPPEVDRRRPLGGVPIANCTAGGDIELISFVLLLRCSDRFMLIGWDRGMEFECWNIRF